MTPLDPSKSSILLKIAPIWAWQNLQGYDRKGCMPNSGPGGCPGTRVMTIFVCHVATQRANPY